MRLSDVTFILLLVGTLPMVASVAGVCRKSKVTDASAYLGIVSWIASSALMMVGK